MLSKIAIAPIRFYQWFISPLIGPCCRFHPSCSEYAVQALSKGGLPRGLYLTARRLLRCHPWGGAGFDPVPDSAEQNSNKGFQ